MIQIYKKGNTDFVYNGESVLMPEKCTLNAKLNDAWEMTLIHPLDEGERWKHIKEEAVICAPTFMGEEQLFRIYDVEKTEEEVIAKARPIFFDSAKDCFLMDVRPDGKNGQQALSIMMAGSKYQGESDITTGSTAYFVRRNLMDALNGEDSPTFVQRWGGEILYDNYKVIINERAGSDRGTEVRYGKNIKGASYHVDMSEVVTRIIPIAYNGRGMSGKDPWVDSAEISKYATVYTKEMKFDNIKLKSDASGESEGDIICKNQAELDARLTAACRKQYEAGVDKPKISINISLADLKGTEEYKEFEQLETIGLGDTAHCQHQVLEITTEARAVEIEWDCIQNVCSSVILGEYEYDYFSELTSALEAVNKVLGPKNTIMAERISGVLNAINTQLRYQKNIAQKQDVRAILFEDIDPTSPSYGAMCLGTQGFQIADKRLQDDSDWDWTTAFTAKGGYASVFITGILSDKTGKNFWNLDTGEFQLSSTQTIVDGQPLGSYLEGVKAFAIRLSNDFQSIPTDYLGNYKVFPEVSTIVYVNFGKDDISSQCTYKVTQSKGVTGNWDNEKRMYTMAGLTEDSGYVDIEATYLGTFKVTKRFNVNKQKSGQPGIQGEKGEDGIPGPPGKDGTISRNYILESSDTVVKKGADNHLSPAQITFKAFYRDGNAASRTAYAGRFKIEESTNGASFVTKYTSAANESAKSYAPSSAEVRIIRCTLYAAGGTTNSLDTQTVVVLTDVSNLEIGGRNLIRNSTFDEGMKYWVTRSEHTTIVPEGRNGKNCLKQVGKLNTDSTITHSSRFPVKIGESYTLSGWAKSANIVKGTTNYFVSIYASFYDAEDKWKAQKDILSGNMPLSDDWERKILSFQVPNIAGITGMRVSLYARDYTGTIWWDDTQLETGNQVMDWTPALEDMETLVITLSNEAHTITTDKNGNGGNFADCETTVQVYNGTQDVTSQTAYTVTKSRGVTGAWDSTNHKYKVTALSTDNGYVDIKAVYNGISVVKRFTISKSKTGATGATGADGKTSYFHIKYAPVQNPTASQMTETPNVFIGTYVDFTPADSTDPKKYTWYRFQGLQGKDGTQGIPGKNGANGQTSYLHIKYSNDGGKTFTANTGETPGDYIGQYVDFVQADSTDPKRYSWSKTKGETGRTYFIELSANILKRKQNNRILPISVSAKAFYRDGTSAARTAYAGRWKVETSTNGVDYTTVVSSTVDESSKSYRVETLAANIVSVRFTLYAAGGLTAPLDMQSIPIVIDVDNLTHEQIFNLLTNNGAMKGIYQSGGQLYINGTYIRSLMITADMIQGKELASLGATLGGFIVESKRIRNTSSDGKKAMYMGSYDWNNSDFLVVQNNASGSWKNLLMLKYDGSLESRDSAQTALAQLNAGSLQFKSKDAGSWVSDMAFTSDGLSRGNRCKISVKAPHQNDLSDGSSPGWSENILGDTHIDGTLRVHQLRVTGGSKQIVKQTEHYGEASFYCDETPTPLLSDYGEGTIASDGLCYVDIDDIFREAVNSNIQYFVFLQKEGPGDCWVKERANTHFVVQGTPGLRFTWAIKIKQKGAEHLRFSEEEQNLRIHSLSPETVMEAEQEETTQQENEAMEQYTNWMFRTMKEMEERYNEEIDIIYEP